MAGKFLSLLAIDRWAKQLILDPGSDLSTQQHHHQADGALTFTVNISDTAGSNMVNL